MIKIITEAKKIVSKRKLMHTKELVHISIRIAVKITADTMLVMQNSRCISLMICCFVVIIKLLLF